MPKKPEGNAAITTDSFCDGLERVELEPTTSQNVD